MKTQEGTRGTRDNKDETHTTNGKQQEEVKKEEWEARRATERQYGEKGKARRTTGYKEEEIR